MSKYLLGVDNGLTMAKAALFTLDGREVLTLRRRQWRPVRRRMQMIFQDPYASLNARMTLGDIVGGR